MVTCQESYELVVLRVEVDHGIGESVASCPEMVAFAYFMAVFKVKADQLVLDAEAHNDLAVGSPLCLAAYKLVTVVFFTVSILVVFHKSNMSQILELLGIFTKLINQYTNLDFKL